MKTRSIISVFVSLSIMLSAANSVPVTVQAAPNNPVQIIQLMSLPDRAYVEPVASAYTLGDGPEDIHKNWLQASYTSTDRLYSMATSTSNTAGDGYAVKIQKDNNMAELAIDATGCTNIVARYWLKDATNANDISEVIQYSSDGGTSYQSLPDKSYTSASVRTHKLTNADNNANIKIRINGSLPIRKSHIVWLDNISIFSDTTAPTWNNPSLSVSNVTDTSIMLNWTPASDNIKSLESGVKSYKIYKNNELLTTVTDNVYCNVTGLEANHSYLFKVIAGDVAENWSSDGPTGTFATAASSDTTPPQWISNELSYSNLGQKSITLSWAGATDDTALEGYRVYQDSTLLGTVSSSVYSYDVNNLAPGVSYAFKVEAGDIVGNWSANGPNKQIVTLTSGIPMMYENFEGGIISNSWELSNSGGTVQIVNDPLNIQGKSIELSDTSATSSVSAKYGIGKKNGVITLEYKFMHKDRVGTMYLPVYGSISGGSDRELFRLSTGSSNMLTYGNDLNAYTNIGVIQTNKWYLAKVIVDINQKLSYISITGEDGTHYISGPNKLYGITTSPYTPVSINKIGFYTKSTDNALLYIDDIKIYDDDLSVDIPVWPSDKNLTAALIGKKDITLQWTEGGDYLGVKKYIIYKNNTRISEVSSDTRSFTISELDPGTVYDFRIEAMDAAGNESIGGPALQVSTLPKDETEPPTWTDSSLNAPPEYIDANSLQLVWTPAIDNTGVTAYRVYKDGVLISTVSGDVLSFTVTGLAQNTKYIFKVSAGDSSDNWGDGPELEISTIGDIKPPVWTSPYFGMESASSTSGVLAISWRGATDNVGITQYRIYEGDTLLGTVSQALFTQTGLVPGEKHTYTVYAGDAAGNWSADNPKVTFQAHDPLLPEWQSGTLSAANVSESSLTLLWNGAMDNGRVSKYRIYRDGILESTVSGDVYNVNITGLMHDTKYEFRVQAVDAMNNESTHGPSISITTAHSDDTSLPGWTEKVLEAADITTNSITLSWSGAKDNTSVTGYRIYNGDNLVSIIRSDVRTYTINDLAPGMPYEFTVQACDAAGNWSLDGPSVQAATLPVFGSTIYVSTIDELNTAVTLANPGDIIIMQNGVYETGTIDPIADKHGLPNSRIIIRAANEDLVDIKAVTGFDFSNCSYITVEGIKFSGKQTVTANQAAINMFGCNNMRITKCHFMLDESQAQNESGYSLAWVTIKSADNIVSHHNQIDRNMFEKKLAPGVTLSIDGDWEAKQVSQYDVIEYNHFKDSKPRVDNGKETIRYGTSYNSQSSAFGIVQYNLFEECDGDPEFLSVKSSDVTIRYNTFLNCMGQFTFRHGDRNTAYGNYFLGDGVKGGVGGMRIYGTDHKVFGNYFQGLTAQTLQIDGGDSYYNGKLTDKWTIRRMEVTFNTIVNCSYGITIWGGREYAPQDITVANNLVVNSGGISYTTSKSAEPGVPTPRPVYLGNMVYPTLYPSGKTTPEINDPSAATEILVIDPVLQLSGNIYRPSASSPVIGAAKGSYSYATSDIDGQKVLGFKDVGADQTVEAPINNRPLTAADVGLSSLGDGPVWNNGKLTASDITTNSLVLTWEGATDNRAVTQYRIYNKNQQIASVIGNVYSVVINGLKENTQYTFTVQALDENGNTNFSGPTVTAKTQMVVNQTPDNDNSNSAPVIVSPMPENDPGIIKVKPSLDEQNRTEAKAVVGITEIEKAFEKASKDLYGNKMISIEVSEISGANSYAIVLPVETIKSGDNSKKLEIKTSVAAVFISWDLMKNSSIPDKGNVTLRIIEDRLSGLPEEIGNRPVISLSIISSNYSEVINECEPMQVSIPYKPKVEELKNPEFITIWNIDSQGRHIPVYSGKYDAGKGTVNFTVTQMGQYGVAYVQKTFEDLKDYEWAQKSIEVLASKGIINGKSEKAFDPGTDITRGDFTLLLVKTLGLTAKVDGNFKDVSENDHYFEALGIAKALGIVKGQEGGNFNPDEKINRQDMMTMAARAMLYTNKLKIEGNKLDIKNYSDSSSVSEYAVTSVSSLVKAGFIKGSEDILLPQKNATRAESAVFLYRIYNE